MITVLTLDINSNLMFRLKLIEMLREEIYNTLGISKEKLGKPQNKSTNG